MATTTTGIVPSARHATTHRHQSVATLRTGSARAAGCSRAALLPGSRALRKAGALHTTSKTPRALSVRTVAAAAAVDDAATDAKAVAGKERPLKVLVAGGGIGGLMLARSLQKKGMDVQVYERVQAYKPFGGPIQLQCNAIGTIEAMDMDLANRIYDNCTVTGDRINGLLDGLNGDWFFRFDTRQPCYRNGLPLTLVINRYTLLDLMVEAVGPESMNTGSEIVDYVEDADGVTAMLADGRTVRGDVLVGADGIRSNVRQAMHKGEKSPLAYSGYTVYTATCDFTAKLTNTDIIGYQVYLGPNKYFVASDVGGSRQQWYAFHLQPEGGADNLAADGNANNKETLLEMFKDWTPAMRERLECTKEEDIERRDVYDVIPSVSPWSWTKGRVALLGDAVHAVQPNLGQGGGQAIESAYTMAASLDGLTSASSTKEIQKRLFYQYSLKRVLRASSVHGLSRMLGLLNIVYRPYLGSNPYPFYPAPVKAFWEAVAKLKMPHPGRIMGQIIMLGSMQYILEYIGSGFGAPQEAGGAPITEANRKGERAVACAVPGIGAPKRPLTDEDFKMQGIPGFGR